MEILDNQKISILISLYREVFAEIRRYRDMEWKILLWTVVLMGGIVTATHIAPVRESHKPYVQTLLCLFTIVSAIYGGWHIHYIHKRLTWYRKLRRKCDRIFMFCDKDIYGKESILQEKWKHKDEDITYKEGLTHLISWLILIALTASYAIYSIIFMKPS